MLLSEPDSLTITGPAGVVVGAKGKLGAVSIEARPPELGVGKSGYPEAEVGVLEAWS